MWPTLGSGGVSAEELAFEFDEDLDSSLWTMSGRQNRFTSWTDEDSDYEISDGEVAKIIVVTQNMTTGRVKHEGYDRTGDWTTRVKLTQELSKVINDGLFYYEQDLWGLHDRHGSKPHKTVELISQEDFDCYAPKIDYSGQAPPPPPPPPPTYEEESFLESHVSSGSTPVATPGPRTPRLKSPTTDTRFYPAPDPQPVERKETPRKQKTKYSSNPPIEHHIGWVIDSRAHEVQASGDGLSTTPRLAVPANNQLSTSLGSTPRSLPPFEHPSHSLLKQNGFTQLVYHKYRSRCLKDRKRFGQSSPFDGFLCMATNDSIFQVWVGVRK